ncbi:sensor domain-containing diguanylate cyclase [Crenobacter intestini]|uniref:Diguanylate cyclase n=1 Tax=Crenobacter intestini TaxID=2563443 RepID=A0A4T0UZU8_9NEIS|nr:diguanylate cyclase [Crenobacter intestini]TIC84772.1 diguanylate cyclase [Crenobacter intestini]
MRVLRLFDTHSLKFRAALFCAAFGWLLSAVLIGVYYLESRGALEAMRRAQVAALVERTATDFDDRLRQRQRLVSDGAAQLTVGAEQLTRDAASLVTRFSHFKGPFSAAILYDRHGTIIADYPSQPGRVGVSVAERDYFRQTRDTLRPQVSDPFLAKTGRRLLVVTAPILGPDGEFSGMLAGTLELFSQEMFGELAGIRIGEHGYIVLLSKQGGRFIYHPAPTLIDRPFQLAGELPSLARALAEGVASVGREGLPDGGEGIVAYRPLQAAGWVLGGALPAGEADAPLLALTRTLLGLGLVWLLLVPPLAWWLMRRLLRPLDAIETQLERAQAGEDHVPLAEDGVRELAHLARAYNRALAAREASEADAAEREAFFKALNEASPLGVLVCSRSGVPRYVNQMANTLLGAADGRWLHNAHGDDCARILRALADAGESAGVTQLRARFRTPGGERLLEASIVALDSACCLVVLLDITRQDAEFQALQGERERQAAILESIADAVVLTNHRDEVEYLNAPAQRMLGVRGAGALGRRLGAVVGLLEPGSGLPVGARVLEAEGRKTLELDLEAATGSRRAVTLTLSSVCAQGAMQGYRVYVLHDDTERRAREASHRYQALHDPLTGLFNRRGLETALHQALQADGVRAALAVLDLDGFKAVNDRGGHAAGDLMLQQVARVLAQRVREGDTVARLGGDEFALLLPGCPPDAAQQLLERVGVEIARLRVAAADGLALGLSASTGVTSLSGDDDAATALARADAACYRAKRAGRDRVELAV